MSTFLGYAGDVFTNILGNVSTLITTVTGSPLLMLFIILPISFLGVTMLRKLLRL